MAAWASITEVGDITGLTDVTDAQINPAQAVVELHVERTPTAAPAMLARDLYWLKQAVAWQTVWQRDQPGYATRSAVKRATQDGASHEYDGKAAVSLAPLAIRAIKNLSWMGNRTVHLRQPYRVPRSFLLESSDDTHLWNPL